MIKNIGSTDRTIRFAAAAVLALLALFVVSGPAAWVFGLVAVVLAGTALAGTCPAYMLTGFSTNRSEASPTRTS
jgi:hypothetical protein